MSHVLAAVDLSPISRRVADRARMVAEEHGVPLKLLHAAEPMGEALVSPEVSRLVFDHRHTFVDTLLGWVRNRTEIEVDAEVVKGSPVWEIVRLDRHAGLTVVGSSAIDQSLIGPVASGVATFGRTDLLVVKRQPRAEYRRIVVAVDFSSFSIQALGKAVARFPDADISLVYSLPTRFDQLMEAAGMFEEEVRSVRAARIAHATSRLEEIAMGRPLAVMDGSPIEMVCEAVRRRTADLLVLATKGGGATKLTLLGTVAAGAMTETPSDVLLVRSPGEFRRP